MPSHPKLAPAKALIRSACATFAALASLTLVPTTTAAIAQEPTSASTSQASIQQEAFTRQIAERIERVPEFKYIREEAARMGVKAYLFGGTAAGYAHYVKWDMQREAGDLRFQPDRFDYDYTNIYRSTQDLDIVVDGPPEKAAELQAKLATQFPHLQGSKTAWEVRLLRQDMGDKQALLNNPDFLNQHTDSNSTGMVEITKPSSGESVVRDLRDWESKNPYFLQDVLNGKIHYYFSPSHGSTTFAKQGRNPPILSVIRFLTKAFQYELEVRPEDLSKIKEVIDAFQPNGPEMRNSYVRNWLLNKDNGRKLIQNAVNIEYAWNTLEKLGLRKKLAAIENNAGTVGSLAWWMNKEPLRTHAVGVDLRTGRTGGGKTARELGLDVIAHETNNFLAYESITRAHTGDPNVLISRRSAAGEAAAHGDGFYTRIGHEGARGTGLTVRFHLSPDAREGTDFTKKGDFVIVHNKAALRVIPESLNVDPIHLFEMLSEGNGFSNSDRALLEKLKRRVSQSAMRLRPEDREKLTSIAVQEFAKPSPNRLLMNMWFSYPFAKDHPELVNALFNKGTFYASWIARHVLALPHWRDHPELVEKLIKKGGADVEIAQFILTQPEWKNHPELVEKLIKKGGADVEIAQFILTQPEWKNHPELVDALIDKGTIRAPWMARNVLALPHWRDHPELVEKLIKKGDADGTIAHMLTEPEWKNHPELVDALIDKGTIHASWIVQNVLALPHWRDHPELVEKLIKKGDADGAIAQYVLSQPEWKDHPKLKALCEGGEVTLANLKKALAPKVPEKPAASLAPAATKVPVPPVAPQGGALPASKSGNCVKTALEKRFL
jgi:hypothetical protein